MNNNELREKIRTILTMVSVSAGNNCDVDEEAIDNFIESAVMRELRNYMTRDGRINFEKALFKKTISINPPVSEAMDGYIIEPITMMGKPYYSALIAGQFVKVPAEHVIKIYNKEQE